MIKHIKIKANELTEEMASSPLFPSFVRKQIADIAEAIARDKIAISQNPWMDENKELWLNKYEHMELSFYYDDSNNNDKLAKTNTSSEASNRTLS